MADTRESLFGPSPQDIAAAQAQQGREQAMQWANMPAGRGAVAGAALAGQGFGNIAGRMLGGQDPAQAKAQRMQAAQQETEAQAQSMGIDLASNPKDYYKVAAQTLHKYGLVDEAQNVISIAQNHDLAERKMQVDEGALGAQTLSAKAAYLKATADKQPTNKSILTLVPPGTNQKTGTGAKTFNLSDPEQAAQAKDLMNSGYIDLSKLAAPPAPGSTVNVLPNAPKSWAETFAEKQATQASSEYDLANNAQYAMQAPQDILNLLEDPKLFTGPGADINFAVGKLLNVAGANNAEVIANTQALYSSMAKSTLDAIPSSNLGGGQGFTESDKQFLRDATGGRINMTRENIAKLAILSMRVQANNVRKWNSRVARLDETGKNALRAVGASTDPIEVPAIPELKKYQTEAEREQGIPAGIDPEDWKHMPEDKKALFRKK